jgi:glycosyltransferase involved in cell wall biosynthesis
MKILLIIPALNNGGAQKQLILNYLSFKNNNYDVKVLSLYKNYENPYLYLINENDLLTLDKKKGKIHNFKILKELYKVADEYDIVHTYLAHALYLCTLSKFFFKSNFLLIGGIRTNSKVNDSIAVYIWNVLNKFIFNLIDKFKLVDIYITPSELTKMSLSKWVNITPIEVIRNMFLDNVSKPINLSNSILKFISSGRICDQKDQIFLVKAFNDLHAQNSILHIYGSKEDHNYFIEFESLLSKLGNENILYLGTYNEPAEKFFSNFDALILTSKYEGFPNVVIEALSVGIPVLLPHGLIDGKVLSSMVYTYKPGDYISFENNLNEMKIDILRGSSRSREFKDNLGIEFSTLNSSYILHLSIYQSLLIKKSKKRSNDICN